MHFTLSILLAALASTLVQSAPTATVDSATLLQNGQEAQKLNAEFQNIKATDSCTTGQTACIGNAIANCVNGQFDTSTGLCSKTQSCFALPNVRSAGTTLFCTSESSALSLINATGATGGITGTDSNDNSGASASDGTNNNGSTTSFTTTSSTADSAAATDIPDVVTVTLTLTPNAVTVEASTQTLSPEQASSLLSSLLAEGASTTSASVSTAADLITSSAAAASATPSTVIQLTATQITDSALATSTSAASTSVPPATIIQLTAAQITQSAVAPSTSTSAVAAITSAPASSSGGYGAGGGY